MTEAIVNLPIRILETRGIHFRLTRYIPIGFLEQVLEARFGDGRANIALATLFVRFNLPLNQHRHHMAQLIVRSRRHIPFGETETIRPETNAPEYLLQVVHRFEVPGAVRHDYVVESVVSEMNLRTKYVTL